MLGKLPTCDAKRVAHLLSLSKLVSVMSARDGDPGQHFYSLPFYELQLVQRIGGAGLVWVSPRSTRGIYLQQILIATLVGGV